MNNFALTSLIAAAIATPLPTFALEDPVIVFPEHLAASDALKDVENWKDAQDLALQMGAMYGASLGSGKVVKAAPYAAEVITETSQTLADGNVIAKRKTGSVYRDGEGRTRQETAMPEGKARTVFITDPVANMNFVLSPGSKRAVGIAPRAFTMKHEGKEREIIRLGGTEIRIEDGKVWIDGKEVNLPKIELVKGGKNIVIEDGKVTIDGQAISKGEGNRNVVIKRVEGEDGTRREEVRVQVMRAGGGSEASEVLVVPATPRAPRAPRTVESVPPIPPIPPLPPLPGIQTLRFDTAHLGKGVTTSLGTKEFDGVKAEGKATTWTIPAGEIGNRNAINVMHETWYSPELKVTVYTRHADPRTGESTYRLASIRRGEPAPDLFKVPDDYSMRSKRAPKG